MMNPSNQLCVVEGAYNIAHTGGESTTIETASARLVQLIDAYKSQLLANSDDTTESAAAAAGLDVVYVRDASSLIGELLAVHTANTETTSVQSSSTDEQPAPSAKKQQQAKSGYLCFLVHDFDQSDTALFIRLEEMHSKRVATSRKFMVYGWPILDYCVSQRVPLGSVVEVERPLYCKLMSGCFVCFTGFRKENKSTVAHCIKLVHYMGGSVRKDYNKRITHLIVKSTLSTKYKTAYNIGRCHLLTEEWIVEAWKHRDEPAFDVNGAEFLKRFQLKALYSLSIAFYGFTRDETQHMQEVTLDNGGTPLADINHPQCTHIVINDQEIRALPCAAAATTTANHNTGVDEVDSASSAAAAAATVDTPQVANGGELHATPGATAGQSRFPAAATMSPFANTRASIVRAEWFWASIQICCRASECLYEFTRPKMTENNSFCHPTTTTTTTATATTRSSEAAAAAAGAAPPAHPVEPPPPNKRMKLSMDNLLSSDLLDPSNAAQNNNNTSHVDSPHLSASMSHAKAANSTNNSHCLTPLAAGIGNVSFGANVTAAVASAAAMATGSGSGMAAARTKKLASSNNLLMSSHDMGHESMVDGAMSSPSGRLAANLNANASVLLASAGNNTTINNTSRLSTNGCAGTGVVSHRANMSNNNLSTSASLLDATADDMIIDSPYEKQQRDSGHGLVNGSSAGSSKKLNKRSQRIYELYETEKRFVTILHTIIQFFKEPIESPDQVAGPILDQTECKEIFGNLPPIYEVHCKIKERLERLVNRLNVNEDAISVGDIYMDNSDALLKTYPPFVNFYEKTKDAIHNCDKAKPRFHAFLKIAQSKPECGRQTLTELLIRPVQRLPSTLLLLDDILKETPRAHRDHDLLSKAIASLKEVMTHINEDKRKIENQLAMFVLINDIENCPATLLSSHRSFLKKMDVYETSSELLKKGAQLTLFLFTDCLEICKPRLKLINATKSPNAAASRHARTPQKCYKHIALFSLNNVTKVCDILQNNDDTDLFGILCRLAGEKDKFFSFKVIPSTAASATAMNCSTSLATNSAQNSTATASSSLTGSHLNLNGNGTTTANSSASNSHNNNNMSSTIYASTSNLTNMFYEEGHQALIEKKEYIKLLAQGICNVKCITEYENILCNIEAKQLQIDLNESGGSKKLDAVKSYARIINRRVSRAFSFSQDTPNKIKKTISSVFRSPFQNSYSQQSLNDQKASKLTSLASLQLTPTLMETKRRFISLQKSREGLFHPFFAKQQTVSNLTMQASSSLLSLENCGTLDENTTTCSSSSSSTSRVSNLLEQTIGSCKADDDGGGGGGCSDYAVPAAVMIAAAAASASASASSACLAPSSSNLPSAPLKVPGNDLTNSMFPSSSLKRQLT